ncbi:R8 protein [Coemansia sp. RSA 2618]|nr:R8 protein [Coemansia sp. RSA 2618]
MFYSQDLLCRRNGRFGAVWLLAMSNGRTRWQSVGSRELAAIDIPQTCADIVAPPAPLSLRLTATLLVGLTHALARKLHHLYADCHAMWTRILSTPWVTSRQGFDPFISAATTVSSAQAITLPVHANLRYLDLSVDVMLAECELDSSGQTRVLKQLGWLETGSANAQADPYTSSWSSLSIPDALTRGDVPNGAGGAATDMAIIEAAALSANNLMSATDRPPEACSSDFGSSDNALDFGFDDASICFDHDGNLHFSSSPPGVSAEVHTEMLSGYLSGQDVASAMRATPDGAHEDNRASNSAAKRSWDAFANDNDLIHNASHSAAKLGGSISMQRPLSPGPELEPETNLLQAAEEDVIYNWSSHAKCQRRHTSRAGHRLDIHSDNTTYERRVTALWGYSCYWDAQMQSRVAATRIRQTQKNVRQFAASAFNVLAALPAHDGLRQMLAASPPPSSRCESPEGGVGFSDDGAPFGMGDSDSELELVRAGSPGGDAQAVDEDELFNIDIDIPWLNPGMLAEMRHQQLPSRPLSVQAESSIDTALRFSGASGSRQSTPASRVSSLDPPSSDDGLDVQPLELAAHNLDTSAVSDGHGLDSFLDIVPRVSAAGDELLSGELSHEAQCFCRFAMARMDDRGSEQLSFDELLLPQHRTRRIAARAFADLLQMATRSVFSVRQQAPYAAISIALE